MGMVGFLSLLILSCAAGSWADSMVLGVFLFFAGFLFFTPTATPVNRQRKGGVSLWTVAMCLIGLAWLVGGDDE
jgi:hypothetical protein